MFGAGPYRSLDAAAATSIFASEPQEQESWQASHHQFRCDSRRVGVVALLLALPVLVLAGFASTGHAQRLRLPGAWGRPEAKADVLQERCSSMEADTDFQTSSGLMAQIAPVRSALNCLAECEQDMRCAAWSWGEDTCTLKGVAPGERPQPYARSGLVAGTCLLYGVSFSDPAPSDPAQTAASQPQASAAARGAAVEFRSPHPRAGLQLAGFQCGGQDWTGPTVCEAGARCAARDARYSECLLREKGPYESWVVVFDGDVRVRSDPSTSAPAVSGPRPHGYVFLGAREGDWVKLDDNSGYVMISSEAVGILLQKFVPADGDSTLAAAAQSPGVYEGATAAAMSQSPTPFAGQPLPSSRLTTTMATSLTTTSTTATTLALHDLHPNGKLFCFALMQPTGGEPKLLRMQYEISANIFGCDEYSVFSNQVLEVAPGLLTSVVNSSLKCDFGGEFGTALNNDIFIAVWKVVLQQGRFLHHDWTVKADPDCVFFPNRLRRLLFHHEPEPEQGVYLNNCKFGMHGPLEVFSRKAVQAWGKSIDRCMQHFTRLCSGPCLWGEDMFIDQCLEKVVGVRRDEEFGLLTEDHCDPPQNWQDCKDPDRVSFHPYKNVTDYETCWATGFLATEEGSTTSDPGSTTSDPGSTTSDSLRGGALQRLDVNEPVSRAYVDTPGCGCQWLGGDSCKDHSPCADACRSANQQMCPGNEMNLRRMA